MTCHLTYYHQGYSLSTILIFVFVFCLTVFSYDIQFSSQVKEYVNNEERTPPHDLILEMRDSSDGYWSDFLKRCNALGLDSLNKRYFSESSEYYFSDSNVGYFAESDLADTSVITKKAIAAKNELLGEIANSFIMAGGSFEVERKYINGEWQHILRHRKYTFRRVLHDYIVRDEKLTVRFGEDLKIASLSHKAPRIIDKGLICSIARKSSLKYRIKQLVGQKRGESGDYSEIYITECRNWYVEKHAVINNMELEPIVEIFAKNILENGDTSLAYVMRLPVNAADGSDLREEDILHFENCTSSGIFYRAGKKSNSALHISEKKNINRTMIFTLNNLMFLCPKGKYNILGKFLEGDKNN